MILSKIDEWIKEVEERPGSALIILNLVARRLRDLGERNEDLLKENIALQDGSRVEEYRKRIVHLEYQLNLLKRRLNLSQEELSALAAAPAAPPLSLLIYNARGRILRLEPGPETGIIGRLRADISAGGESPRLLAVAGNEELLLLFTSGRISTCPVEDIPTVPVGGGWTWERAALPDEAHGGERLVGIMPLSGLPLADFFLQASRRGCLKKTMTSISESVFENKFLGKGAIQKMDQPLDISLCQKKDNFAVVSHAGRLLGLNVDELSYSVEERFKLDATDHVVAGFVIHPEELLLCLTNTGKVISKSADFIEPMKSASSRGQSLIPAARLEQMVRFIGAAAARQTDRLAVLDASGKVSLSEVSQLTGAGALSADAALLAFGILPAPTVKYLSE